MCWCNLTYVLSAHHSSWFFYVQHNNMNLEQHTYGIQHIDMDEQKNLAYEL